MREQQVYRCLYPNSILDLLQFLISMSVARRDRKSHAYTLLAIRVFNDSRLERQHKTWVSETCKILPDIYKSHNYDREKSLKHLFLI